VAKNFDQQIFKNLGQGMREEVAEVLAAIVDAPGFLEYVSSTLKE
tara:strand:- start:258 stop:392 length:135 start_codon:yes stop_codon:yes gene_type:complete